MHLRQQNLIESGVKMKRTYQKPMAKKIDYDFQEQIMATSIPIQTKLDPWDTKEHCTWGTSDCSAIFNVMARGLNDCIVQGDVG